jgi:hypothetical protein
MKGKRKARYDFRESVKVRDGYNRDTNAARAKERSQASYDPENPIKQKRSDYKGEGLKNPSIIHRIKTAVQTTTGKQIENRKERERKRRSRKRGR